jgi:hypothetical protein
MKLATLPLLAALLCCLTQTACKDKTDPTKPTLTPPTPITTR